MNTTRQHSPEKKKQTKKTRANRADEIVPAMGERHKICIYRDESAKQYSCKKRNTEITSDPLCHGAGEQVCPVVLNDVFISKSSKWKKFGKESDKRKKEGEKEVKLWKDETYIMTTGVMGLKTKIFRICFLRAFSIKLGYGLIKPVMVKASLFQAFITRTSKTTASI